MLLTGTNPPPNTRIEKTSQTSPKIFQIVLCAIFVSWNWFMGCGQSDKYLYHCFPMGHKIYCVDIHSFVELSGFQSVLFLYHINMLNVKPCSDVNVLRHNSTIVVDLWKYKNVVGNNFLLRAVFQSYLSTSKLCFRHPGKQEPCICRYDWVGYPLEVAFSVKTHWGRDKMDATSHTTFSSALSWMKMYEFRLKFHWSLFPMFQLTVFQHCLR